MYLEVGNRLRIDDPTPEQVSHHLSHLPADAPFLILNADAEHFVQATSLPADAGGRLRVEWRQESRQSYMLAPAADAKRALLAFLRWDEAELRTMPSKGLSLRNDPYRQLVLAVALVAVIAILRGVWAVWR